LIYWPEPDPGPVQENTVVLEKTQGQETPGRSKNAWTWTLGTGRTQALVQVQLDL